MIVQHTQLRGLHPTTTGDKTATCIACNDDYAERIPHT